MINDNKGYVIFDTKKQEFISIDMSSGGMPYHTDALWGAKIFRDKKSADRYCILSKESINWVVLTIGVVEDTA